MTEQMRDSSVRSAQLGSGRTMRICEGKFFVSDRAKDKTDASSLCVAQLDASDVLDDYILYLGIHIVYACVLAYTSGHCNKHSANLTLQQFGNRSR